RGDAPAPGVPRPGQPVPGVPAATTAAAAANPAAARPAGMPMGMGPMGAGAGRGRDTEGEHSSPDYLHRRWEELQYDEPAMPPVIGADALDDQPPPTGDTGGTPRGPQR